MKHCNVLHPTSHVCDGASNSRTWHRAGCRCSLLWHLTASANVPCSMSAGRLPLTFEPELSNPCFRDANGTRRCLPAFFIAGAMQCGSADLWAKLRKHEQILDEHDALSHWWTNHPRSRAGLFDAYLDRFSNVRTLKALRREPRALLGEASPATFTFMMAESLRLHHLYLDAFSACHSSCRSRSPPPEHAAVCKQRAYAMDHCYGEATAKSVPIGFNVPSMIVDTMGSRPPKVIVMLREPSVRLWVAFWSYGQYPAKYGASEEGFTYYFGNQSAAFEQCVHSESRGHRKCALRFEGYSAAEAAVYYHCDQIIKGLYAAFLPEWQAALPPERLLIVRTEDYIARPLRWLRRAVAHLGLRPMSEAEVRGAERTRKADEFGALLGRGRAPPSSELLAPMRRFYRPWNRVLAGMLKDDSFMWRDVYARTRSA